MAQPWLLSGQPCNAPCSTWSQGLISAIAPRLLLCTLVLGTSGLVAGRHWRVSLQEGENEEGVHLFSVKQGELGGSVLVLC